MRKLPKPCDSNGTPYDARHVFETCISRVRNPSLKLRLASIALQIAESATEYDTAASTENLHSISEQTSVGDVSAEELVSVYILRMVPKAQPGRPIYDKIIGAPAHGRCPLCDLGTVATLDHHLPKTRYPSVVVAPNNLVPSCNWCQFGKLETAPMSAREQTLHPYFDDCETHSWLTAEIVESHPAVWSYFIVKPQGGNDLLEHRLNHHMATFRLGRLYSQNAASELSGIRSRLHKLLIAGGKDAVKFHLREEAETWENHSKNSWKAAMYRAAAASDWFCEGGFSNE